MRPWEHKRATEISEYIVVTHISCLLLFLMIVFSFYNVPLGTIFPIFPIIVFVVSALGTIVYTARKILPKILPLGQSRLDEILLLLVIYPLTFTFLWLSHNFYGAKVLLLVPAIIAATAFGKVAGTIGGILATALLFFFDYRLFHSFPFPSEVFQADVIVGSVIILLSWLTGGLMEVERGVQQALVQLADYDQLTGLYNHRCLQERLMLSIKEAQEKAQPLTVVLLDIDQFKYFNAVYGYQKGDEILAAIGKLLLQEIGPPYYAARYANDEFALVFPGKKKEEALSVAAKLKEKIAQEATLCLLDTREPPCKPFTLTMGSASFPEDADAALPVIRAAENDLFRAKSSQGKARLYQSILSEICALKVKEAFPTLQTLVALINAKDRYTYGHSERVMSYSLALAEKLNLSVEDKDALRYGAYLHDLGKIEIESSLLNKDGPLTKEEWEIMKTHPLWGSELLRPLIFFQKIALILRYHHENYNGSGYPDGLKGENIPLLARIVRLADSFDAMTTDRPYRKGLTFEQASEELRQGAGTLYDPKLVEVFLEAVKEVYEDEKTA
ncbi:MAG: diguanylate cyclase [Thermanaeromonas sp.]|uniref:bifunctional diguanylate cyclase/phosphohydrolase n=1 Tax=Thermanaeromonas sp. TaxID=2003697 RepID=UPI00243AF3E6|nr:diguanylate cyclase [Thermanaeromonas sp.]MCG0278329.1 diguanylate cyclase [Thermanaeromonas sp.]